jgi:multimeric flavodoxin WrbA
MKVCILMGSPRKKGNTAALLDPFCQQLEAEGAQCQTIWLYDREIQPCIACRACQRDWSVFGCSRRDGMGEIFEQILACDLLVLATPIYSWYCTPPMKAALDRLVYGMNKYYGEEKGPALWAGKGVALLTTCGYRPEVGADLWETGIKRYCKHSQLRYLGMLAERHLGYQTVFMDGEKAERARAFARGLWNGEKSK